MAYSLSYGTSITALTDCGTVDYGNMIVEARDITAPPLQLDRVTLPAYHGGYQQGSYVGERTISFSAVLSGTSWADVLDKLDTFNGLADPTACDGYLLFGDQPDRAWYGRFMGGHVGHPLGPRAMRLSLEFACRESLAYDMTEDTQTLTITVAAEAFTVPAAGSVRGNAACYPTYLLKNTSGGAFNFSLTNGTEWLTIPNIPDGGWVRATWPLYLELSEDNGSTYASCMNKSSNSEPQFIPLSGGSSNTLTVYAIGGTPTGTLDLTYRGRWV